MREVKCTWIPNAANIGEWVTYMMGQVHNAARRKDYLAAEWFHDIRDATSYNDLREVPVKFMQLDASLCICVTDSVKAAGKTSNLHKQLIADRHEAELRKRVVAGQQVVWRVLASTRTNDSLARVFGTADLMAIWPKGQGLKDIQNFRRDWETTAAKVTGADESEKTNLLPLRSNKPLFLRNPLFRHMCRFFAVGAAFLRLCRF